MNHEVRHSTTLNYSFQSCQVNYYNKAIFFSGSEATATRASKYHPSNWVDADEEDDEGDDDSEFVVEATPPHH